MVFIYNYTGTCAKGHLLYLINHRQVLDDGGGRLYFSHLASARVARTTAQAATKTAGTPAIRQTGHWQGHTDLPLSP